MTVRLTTVYLLAGDERQAPEIPPGDFTREERAGGHLYAHLSTEGRGEQADRTCEDMIDSKSQDIKPASDETYSDMLDLADELPDSSPRFVLLSYPLTLVQHTLCIRPLSLFERSKLTIGSRREDCPSHMCCCIIFPRTATRARG